MIWFSIDLKFNRDKILTFFYKDKFYFLIKMKFDFWWRLNLIFYKDKIWFLIKIKIIFNKDKIWFLKKDYFLIKI